MCRVHARINAREPSTSSLQTPSEQMAPTSNQRVLPVRIMLPSLEIHFRPCKSMMLTTHRKFLPSTQDTALLSMRLPQPSLTSNLVLESFTDLLCEGKFGMLSTFALDSPIAILAHDAHFVPRSLPTIDFPGEREPHSLSPPQFAQESQQLSINAPRPLLNNVIRMNSETHQPVSLRGFRLLGSGKRRSELCCNASRCRD